MTRRETHLLERFGALVKMARLSRSSICRLDGTTQRFFYYKTSMTRATAAFFCGSCQTGQNVFKRKKEIWDYPRPKVTVVVCGTHPRHLAVTIRLIARIPRSDPCPRSPSIVSHDADGSRVRPRGLRRTGRRLRRHVPYPAGRWPPSVWPVHDGRRSAALPPQHPLFRCRRCRVSPRSLPATQLVHH